LVLGLKSRFIVKLGGMSYFPFHWLRDVSTPINGGSSSKQLTKSIMLLQFQGRRHLARHCNRCSDRRGFFWSQKSEFLYFVLEPIRSSSTELGESSSIRN
jgi:hypothetical protein